MSVYYNENDPHAAAWLRELIRRGLIASGDVDERSILDVRADDLRAYGQCHFFAGIGGWSYALRLAGISDDLPVWTGSCPCQPFSAAGAQRGSDDERHLWPAFFGLIRECRPATVIGEQVAGALVVGRGTSDAVQALWNRKATAGVLKDWIQEPAADGLQSLPELGAPRVALSQEAGCLASRGAVGIRNEGARGSEGARIRPYAGVDSGATGSWHLRGERPAIRHGSASGLEHSIAGSHHPGGWLCANELPHGHLCPECRLRRLGREQTDRGGARRPFAEAEALERASEQTKSELAAVAADAWFDGVALDLEGVGYSVGAANLGAHSAGAPHMRQRLYWVAHADGRIASAEREQRGRQHGQQPSHDSTGRGDMGHAESARSQGERSERRAPHSGFDRRQPGLSGDAWADVEWLACTDGKARPTQRGIFPLAHGVSKSVGRSGDSGAPLDADATGEARVMRLRGYGNAIVPQIAAMFVRASMEVSA